MNKTKVMTIALAAALAVSASGFAADSAGPGSPASPRKGAPVALDQMIPSPAKGQALPLTVALENSLRRDNDRLTAADFEINTMVFVLDNGTELRVHMRPETVGKVSEDLESINFEGGNQSVIVPTANIANIRYVFDEADVKQIAAEKEQYSLAEGSVAFSNLPAGSHAVVADLDGRILFSADVQGDWSHSLTQYPAGVYIVSVNNTFLKFIIK